MRIPSKHDPYKVPNWRWERARWLRSHGKFLRKNADDEFTQIAKQFQAHRDRVRNDVELYRLEQRYPGIFHAEEMSRRSEANARWTVEARLLAGEAPARIAQRSAVSEDVIYWYEKLFFNVLPYLGCDDYVVNQVIGPSCHHGLNDREYDVLWKLFGYWGKSHVLDFMITGFNKTAAPDRPEGVSAWLADDARMTIRRKSAIAVRLLPLHNSFAIQVVLETHARLLEIEKAGEGGGTADLMLDAVRSMVICFGGSHDGRGGGLLYAGNKPSYGSVPRLEHYDNQAYELRSNEQMQVTLGQTPPKDDDVDWSFPAEPAREVIVQGGQP